MRNRRINRRVNRLVSKVNKGITLNDKEHAFMLKHDSIYELFLKTVEEEYEK